MEQPSTDKTGSTGPDLRTLQLAAMRQLLMEFERLIEKLREMIESFER